MGTSIVSSRNGATGSDSKPPSGPEEQEKPTPRVRQHRRDWAQHERSEWDTTVQERGNDHQPLTHQTTLPQGRETNGKPGLWIEGDSKAPSANIASSTCRKAGARGKHTRNVVTTPGNIIEEEKSLEQVQGNRPEERTSLQDPASNARHRYCGAGQPQSWKRDNPMGSPIPAPHPLTSEWRRLQRERKREKNGRQAPEPPLQLATKGEGDEGEDGYRAGRTTQRCSPLRIRSRRHRQHP